MEPLTRESCGKPEELAGPTQVKSMNPEVTDSAVHNHVEQTQEEFEARVAANRAVIDEFTEEQLNEIYVQCVTPTPSGFELNVTRLIMMFTLFSTVKASPESEMVIANSLAMYNYVFMFLMMGVVVGWMAMIYSLFCLLQQFVKFGSKEYRKMVKFVESEYNAGKVFTQQEYNGLKQFTAVEFAEFKSNVTLYMKIGVGLQALSCLIGIGSLFKSNSFGVSLPGQGVKKDANRFAYFMTGALSLVALLFGPVFGFKKVNKYMSPFFDWLKKIPYAVWFYTWVRRWFDSEFEFDDLPTNDKMFDELSKGMDEDEDIREAKDNLNFVREKMKNFPKKQNLDEDSSSEEQNLSVEDLVGLAQSEFKGKGVVPNCYFSIEPNGDFVTIFMIINGKTVKTTQLPSAEWRMPFCSIVAHNVSLKPKFKYCGEFYDSMVSLFERINKTVEFEGVDEEDTCEECNPPLSPLTPIDKLEAVAKVCQRESVPLEQHEPVLILEPEIKQKWTDPIDMKKIYDIDRQLDVIEGKGPVTSRPPKPVMEEPHWIWEYANICWEEIKSTPADVYDFFLPQAKEAEVLNLTKKTIGLAEMSGPLETFEKIVFACASYWNVHKKGIIKGVSFVFFLWMVSCVLSDRKSQDELLVATTQGKGKTKQGRGQRRARGGKGRKYKVMPSGGDEQKGDEYEEPSDDDYDQERYDKYAETYQTHIPERKAQYGDRRRPEVDEFGTHIPRNRYAPPQGSVELPPVRKEQEPEYRRRVYKSKQPKVAKAEDIARFLDDARKAYALKPQAFNTNALSAGVYKFYRCSGGKQEYCCTATHVGDKLWVVMHCLSEDVTTTYKAVNHVHTFDLKGTDVVLFGEQLACFPVTGFPSPFKTNALKVLEDAAIVTVFGYGSGVANSPDSILGFASPLGWCNAPTRDGDCTSPALDKDGKIVGFWTHGNGKDFGRFEPVSQAMIDFAKQGRPSIHSGLDFRFSPPSR